MQPLWRFTFWRLDPMQLTISGHTLDITPVKVCNLVQKPNKLK